MQLGGPGVELGREGVVVLLDRGDPVGEDLVPVAHQGGCPGVQAASLGERRLVVDGGVQHRLCQAHGGAGVEVALAQQAVVDQRLSDVTGVPRLGELADVDERAPVAAQHSGRP